MIIIGTTNLRRTRDRGDFRCPECRRQRHYRLNSVRPFLSIYWIPIIPIGETQEYVQCEKCGEAFGPAILEIDASTAIKTEQRQFHQEVLNTAVLTVVADGTITQEEIDTLGQVAEYLTGEPIDREELGNMCGAATQVGFKAHNYLRSIVNRWDRDQKVVAMKAIFLATSAGGELRPEQLDALVKIRTVLGLSKEDFESAVEESLAISDEL